MIYGTSKRSSREESSSHLSFAVAPFFVVLGVQAGVSVAIPSPLPCRLGPKP